jgi:hypothetical protein
MNEYERETVKRILEATLRRLGQDSDGSGVQSGDSYRDHSNSSVIILLTDNSNDSSNDNFTRPFLTAGDAAAGGSNVSQITERKVSHPAQEQFTMIEAASHVGAPKSCFLEPERVCVNSGACQMRGV